MLGARSVKSNVEDDFSCHPVVSPGASHVRFCTLASRQGSTLVSSRQGGVQCPGNCGGGSGGAMSSTGCGQHCLPPVTLGVKAKL